MNYRSIADMDRLIRKNLSLIPRDIDLIVGIPRSGLLPASILALLLNKPLKSLSELGNEASYSFSTRKLEKLDNLKKILVVDDSCLTGGSLNKAKEFLSQTISSDVQIIYCCIYAIEETASLLDMYFEICNPPRLFEWNIMNHIYIQGTCMDLDGVLCVDPTEEQNDDGEKYIDFVKNAVPLFAAPKYPIGAIVTSRLEKYRGITEEWLERNNIKYQNLIMLDVPDKETRQRLQLHSRFKASVYLKSDALLFIESSDRQAQEIFNYTNKPVYCTESNKFYYRDNSFDQYEITFKEAKTIEEKAYSALGIMYDFYDKTELIISQSSNEEIISTYSEYIGLLNNVFNELYKFVYPDEGVKNWVGQYTTDLQATLDAQDFNKLINVIYAYTPAELEYLIDNSIYNIVHKAASNVTTLAWLEEQSRTRSELESILINGDTMIPGYENEISFLKKHGSLELYPYEFIYKYNEDDVIVHYDDQSDLKYVIHNGKKLFFPPRSDESVRHEYNQLIMKQDPESPHTYFSENCSFNKGDIFVDVGAAEGIISLDIIEKASEVYLIECSESWIRALNSTFSEYKDKIHIIPKYAGRVDTDNSITLDTLLAQYKDKNIFIKMDVEGMELDILKGAVNTLLVNNCKLSCTTYHSHDAELELSTFFDNVGYNHAPSDRYMLFFYGKMTLDNGKYEHIKAPYFRRALVRAWK